MTLFDYRSEAWRAGCGGNSVVQEPTFNYVMPLKEVRGASVDVVRGVAAALSQRPPSQW